MRIGLIFPTADRVTGHERKNLGLPLLGQGKTIPGETVKAVSTGEFRAPKKGEWYLSGGPVEAYKAPNDLSDYDKFNIATLVKVRKVVSYQIIE